MDIKRRKSISVILIIGIIFAVVGICFLIAGIAIYIGNNSFFNNSEQTDAVISRIETEQYKITNDRRIRHDVWVKYEINGENFEELLGYFDSGMRKGDVIAIHYDPNDPSKIRSVSGLKIILFVFVPLGSVFAILGIVFISINASSVLRRNKLIQTGERLTGVITKVKINNYVAINNRHPFKAECEVTDPYSGETVLYTSENITEDISGLVGMEVTVYVDSDNIKNYYVDVSELLDRYDQYENISIYR